MITDRIQLLRADITTLRVDAIVNSANAQLTPAGHVGLAIHAAAGPELEEECRSREGGVATGDAIVTKGYRLAPFIIHAVGPSWHGGKKHEAEQLARVYRRCFQLAREQGIHSIAFPAISCGVYGYPPADAAQIALRETVAALRDNESIERVVFAVPSEHVYEAFRAAYESIVTASAHA